MSLSKMVHGIPDTIISYILQERLAFDNTIVCVRWQMLL